MNSWHRVERDYWDGGSSDVEILADPEVVSRLVADHDAFVPMGANVSLQLDAVANRILAAQRRGEPRGARFGDQREAYDWLTPMQMRNRRLRESGGPRDVDRRSWFWDQVQAVTVYRGLPGTDSRHFGSRGIGPGRYDREPKPCSVEDCDRMLAKSSGRGMCALHYNRWRRARLHL